MPGIYNLFQQFMCQWCSQRSLKRNFIGREKRGMGKDNLNTEEKKETSNFGYF
jgi:hypothetical protein